MRLSTFKPAYSKIIFNEDFTSVKSTSDNGGVITGTPTIDKSAVFDGVNEYIRYPNFDWSKLSDFSITGKVNDIDTTAAGAVVSGDNSGLSPMIRVDPGGSSVKFWTSVALASKTWSGAFNTAFTYAVTFDSSTNQARFYLNGSLISAQTMAGGLSTTSNLLSIGARGTADDFKGSQDHVTIYDSILSAEEAKDLYEQDTYFL